MLDIEFDEFRKHQYCDNKNCIEYGVVGSSNVCIKTRKNRQLYCNKCQHVFSVRKGTMFYGLRTPMDAIIRILCLLCSGIGVNALCRTEKTTPDSLRSWIVLASKQVDGFNRYMTEDMHLEQVQIDEFWSFIRKKTKI